MTRKERLIRLFSLADECRAEFIALFIEENNDIENHEIIIIQRKYFNDKLKCYNENYDVNLHLNLCKNVKITGGVAFDGEVNVSAVFKWASRNFEDSVEI